MLSIHKHLAREIDCARAFETLKYHSVVIGVFLSMCGAALEQWQRICPQNAKVGSGKVHLRVP
jgi:hypothetical protein